MRVTDVASSTIAGPRTIMPGRSRSRQNTSVDIALPALNQTGRCAMRAGCGSCPVGVNCASAIGARAPVAATRTLTSSIGSPSKKNA